MGTSWDKRISKCVCVKFIYFWGHPERGWSQYPSEPICLPDELCKHHRVIVGAHIKDSLTTHWLIYDWYAIQNKGVCCLFYLQRNKKRAQQKKERKESDKENFLFKKERVKKREQKNIVTKITLFLLTRYSNV